MTTYLQYLQKAFFKKLSYKESLFVVLIVHLCMFAIVLAAGIVAKSTAVLADSLDFIGDSASYALSIYVLDKSIRFRAITSIMKAVTMFFGCIPMFIYAVSCYNQDTLPDTSIMSMTGLLGIIAHSFCVYLLLQCQRSDSNMLSVWVCTVNDMISNILIIISSLLVSLTNSIIPDILTACIIVSIALYGAVRILRCAINELKVLTV
jgi:Co/Zn/Cd efflux system component